MLPLCTKSAKVLTGSAALSGSGALDTQPRAAAEASSWRVVQRMVEGGGVEEGRGCG